MDGLASTWRRALAARVLIAIAFVVCGARAQVRDSAAAEALFESGRQALERADYQEACAKFEESQRLDPAAGTLLNIGRCSEELGRVVKAWQIYTEVARMLEVSDPRAPYANERRDALAARVPWLTLTLAPGSPQGTSVELEGTLLSDASFGVALPVNPPRVELVVRAPGRRETVVAVELAEGERKELTVEPGPVLPQSAPAAAPPPKPSKPSRTTLAVRPAPVSDGTKTLGYVVGAVGLAGLVTGGVTTVLMLQAHSDVEADCDEKTKECDSQAGIDALEKVGTFSTVSTIALAVGIAGTGVGVYLVLRPSAPTAPVASIGLRGSF